MKIDDITQYHLTKKGQSAYQSGIPIQEILKPENKGKYYNNKSLEYKIKAFEENLKNPFSKKAVNSRLSLEALNDWYEQQYRSVLQKRHIQVLE